MISTKNDNRLRHLICAKQFTKFLKMVKFDFMFSKGSALPGLSISFSYLLQMQPEKFENPYDQQYEDTNA